MIFLDLTRHLLDSNGDNSNEYLLLVRYKVKHGEEIPYQAAMFYCVHYLSNRPQVSVVYKLINHVGCW